MTARKPAAPRDLATRGRAFWKATVAAFTLNESELRLLHECCRILDELDDLRAAVVAEGVTTEGARDRPWRTRHWR
jgi:hypothetical protein